jgi:hypothetical protein
VTILYDKDGNSLEIDDIARALHNIDTVHGMVHKGKLFSCVAENQTLANNGYLYMLIQPTRAMHMRYTGFCGGNAHIWLYKNPTWAAASPDVKLDIEQHNDLSTKTSGAVITQDPSVSSVGTPWGARLPIFGGQGGVNAIGSDLSFGHERILDPANEYLLVIQNISGQAQDAHILVNFYEPGA